MGDAGDAGRTERCRPEGRRRRPAATGLTRHVADAERHELAAVETVILLTPARIPVSTPVKWRGGCSRQTVSPTARCEPDLPARNPRAPRDASGRGGTGAGMHPLCILMHSPYASLYIILMHLMHPYASSGRDHSCDEVARCIGRVADEARDWGVSRPPSQPSEGATVSPLLAPFRVKAFSV